MAMRVSNPQDAVFNFFELDEEKMMEQFQKIPKDVECHNPCDIHKVKEELYYAQSRH